MHYPSHIPRGKGASDFGEGVPSSTLSHGGNTNFAIFAGDRDGTA